MKLQSIFFAALVLATFTVKASAQSASADYSISTQSIDAGGTTLSSTSYSINASVNDSGSMASAVVSGCVAKGGYAGQLYDVVGLLVSASSMSVNEGTSLQLGAAQLLDDSTCLILSSTAPVWSVISGPVVSISTSGLATAGLVYQNCPANVGAAFLGMSGTLSLTIINTNNDDYGSYAGNSLLENWLVQYFGPPPNSNAGPNVELVGEIHSRRHKHSAAGFRGGIDGSLQGGGGVGLAVAHRAGLGHIDKASVCGRVLLGLRWVAE